MSLADAISAVAAEKLEKKSGKEPKGKITAAVRKKTATVHSGGKAKFPIPPGDKKHARSALRLINTAKPPLSSSQKAAVRAKANRTLGKKGDGVNAGGGY
jgi:hypothetical protein